MDACYHHLYEYGSIGIFGVIGRAVPDPGSPTSGPDRRRSMTLRWTFDERCEDGLVAGIRPEAVQADARGPPGDGIPGSRCVLTGLTGPDPGLNGHPARPGAAAARRGFPRSARIPRRLACLPVR